MARDARQVASAVARRLEHIRFRSHVRRVAWMARATITVDIHPSVRIHHRTRLQVFQPIEASLVIGPRSRIERDVILELRGGSIRLGEDVHVRRGCRVKSSGKLELHDRVILGDYCSIQCSNEVVLGERVGLSDGVMVVDSSHVQDPEDGWFYTNSIGGTVFIGPNSWVAANSTVARNSHIGRQCIVGANTLVVGTSVPNGHSASGSPLEIRPLPQLANPSSSSKDLRARGA